MVGLVQAGRLGLNPVPAGPTQRRDHRAVRHRHRLTLSRDKVVLVEEAGGVGPLSFRVDGPIDILQRMENAVEKVRQRLTRAANALKSHSVPYAVAGGNAVAAWVATVDDAAVRNTQDVDILIRRADLPAATKALESAGFVHRHAAGLDLFLDGPGAKP